VPAFKFPARLGMARSGADLFDPGRAQHAFEVGCPVESQAAGEAAAIVVHDMGGQAPLLHGAGEGLPGDFGCGAGIDADRDQSTRVIVEDVHDPHRLPIGEGPGGGVDLPSVVGPGPFEPSPGSMGTLARLRRPIRAAPGHGEWRQPMERSHRGVRGGRRWPGRRSQREVPCAAG